MGKVIKLTRKQEEEEEAIKTAKKQKGKSIKLTRKQKKEVKEFKNDINLCLIQIKRMKKNLVELEELEQFLESLLDKEHYDDRIPPAIKGMNILLKEVTTLLYQGLSEIKRKLR
jgi:hypothetical protein